MGLFPVGSGGCFTCAIVREFSVVAGDIRETSRWLKNPKHSHSKLR